MPAYQLDEGKKEATNRKVCLQEENPLTKPHWVKNRNLNIF
jgi:hypothetical protein